jgi:hypothetical protein
MKKLTQITKAEWIHLVSGLGILMLAYTAGYIASDHHYFISWFLMGIAGAILGLTS